MRDVEHILFVPLFDLSICYIQTYEDRVCSCIHLSVVEVFEEIPCAEEILDPLDQMFE